MRKSRIEFHPTYWRVFAVLTFPAPKPGCPRNHFLRRNRARRQRREYEAMLTDLLTEIEAATRFPAYLMDPTAATRPGDGTGFYQPWTVKIQTYSFDEAVANAAAEVIRATDCSSELRVEWIEGNALV